MACPPLRVVFFVSRGPQVFTSLLCHKARHKVPINRGPRRDSQRLEPPPAKVLDLLADDPVKNKAGEATQEEIRTLWVDFDEHGERFTRWRDVCKESYAPVLDDKPIDGPLTCKL